ncbi:hypothetical protein WNY37_07375 [Henriciella sp. AS95]|uniref:hypothetical protein n=1 Tax=Henriciella sp. AS95 TaxID=3135782 RepID=UPI003174C175
MRRLTRLALIALTVSLSSCSEAMLKSASNGNQIPADYPVAQVDGAPASTVGQVATGQPVLTNKAAPAPFEFVDAEAKCRMPRPSGNARVAYAYFYGGGVKTPLQYVADANRAEQLQQRIRLSDQIADEMGSSSFDSAALAREAAAFAKGNAVEWLTRVDVLVTETDAPVYLVLTSYNAVLWNIQTAPGVEIDGIVVSAYEGGAIANGVDPKRTGFMGHRGAPNRSCYLDGQGRPVTVEARIAGAKDLNPDFDATRYRDRWAEEYRQGLAFFRTELPRKIGKRVEWIITQGPKDGTKAILVGDVPAEPFQQQPITKIQLPSYVWPYWGDRRSAYKYFGLER